MKKIIMMAVISGMVLGCLGCPPGQGTPYPPTQYYLGQDMNGDVYFNANSVTGMWQITLHDAVNSGDIEVVKKLLIAGAKDHNNDCHNRAIELANRYLEMAKMIKDSEEKHINKKFKEEK